MSQEMTQEEKEFEEFFNEAVDSEDGVKHPTDKKKEEEDVPEKDDVPEQENDPEPEPEPKVEKEEPVDDSVVQTGNEPKDDNTVVNWEARFHESDKQLQDALATIKRLEHKMSSWEGRITKANERATKAEEALEAEKAKKSKPEPSDDDTPSEDDELLKAFADEFPDLVKPLKLYAKQYAEQIADERLGKVAPTVEAIQEKQKQSETEMFFAPIYEAHPDWKDIYEEGKLSQWIDTLPPLQQRVYNEVVDNGSQEEIIEMFDAYKKALEPEKENEHENTSGEVNKDLENLTAVPGRSGGPPKKKKVDKSDFDSGWRDAISSG